MKVFVGSAKTPKAGVSESGDTLEVIERRKGGLSLVLADGQGSGPAAKRISAMVVARAMSLIAEGVRDGAAARAAHDFLYALRDGKVSCELVIVSADAHAKSVVVTRNTEVPVVLRSGSGQIRVLNEEALPIGVYESARPSILQIPMQPNTMVVAMTDGITQCGSRTGRLLLESEVAEMTRYADSSEPQALAEAILEKALDCDSNRAMDDMCVVVMSIVDRGEHDRIRRLEVEFPI